MISTNQSVLHLGVPVNVSEVVSGGHYEVNNNVISTQQYLHNNIYTTISTRRDIYSYCPAPGPG